MTMQEIREFFGFKNINAVSRMFHKAAKDDPEIANRLNNRTKDTEPDFTLEQCLFTFKYVDKESFEFSPATIRLFKESFIERSEPIKMKIKNPKLTSSQKSFLNSYWYKRKSSIIIRTCATCGFFGARTMNRSFVKPSPYCYFYEVFLNKATPKRDVYKDSCPTYKLTFEYPLIFTPQGVFNASDFESEGVLANKKGIKNEMLGISQDKFKSKRKRDEEVIILRDAFSD